MQRVKQKTADHWSLVSILAHEVGHHVAFHTVIDGHDHKFELEADYFSGFVLRRLGASLEQTDTAIRLISPKEPGPSHPGLDDRLQAITLGWTDGGKTGAPAGLNDAKQPTAGEQTAAAEAARICREVEGMSSLPMLGVLANQHKGTPVSDCIGTRLAELKRAETARAEVAKKAELAEMAARAEAERKQITTLLAEQARRRAEANLLRPGQVFRDCEEVCPEMVVLPAGEFMMGWGDFGQEAPPHKVTIQRAFAVGKFEVTFDEWDACVKDGGCIHRPDDRGWGRGRRPVIKVSWHDAKEYAAWLSKKTGRSYRFLSEAEWEYAARAGTTTRYAFGGTISERQAHYLKGARGDPAQGTMEVGSFPANTFGLHDLHGNVSEWCEDNWHPDYKDAPVDGSVWMGGDATSRVVRGGSWNDFDWQRGVGRPRSGPA